MTTNLYEDWSVGDTYDFSTTAPGILDASYKRVILTAIATFDVARMVNAEDVYAKWRVIYPSLPAGTPNTPEMAAWYIFKNDDGETFALAAPWIDGSTVVGVNFTSYNIAVSGSSLAEMTRVRNLLASMRLTFEITQNP